ncbi:lipase family protein [Candidatus Omnitrophota bacterium]
MAKLAYIKFEENETKKNELIESLKKANFSLNKVFDCNGTQAFLALREKDKMVILAFRGTEKDSLKDIISDLDARYYKDENGEKSHKGFLKAFQYVEEEVRKSLDNLTDCALYITGHSLGGALAMIATHSLNSDNLAACYAFGGPRVGNSEFGDTIKPPIYRVVNDLDPVPFLPPTYLWEALRWFAQKFNWEKLLKFAEKMKGYAHHGDLRFLPACNADFKDARVITDRNDFFRFIQYLIKKVSKWKEIAADHAVDLYCEKLAQYALKRLKAEE